MYLKVLILSVLYWACLANKKVLEFTDSDFDSEIAEHAIALVMFYAPWCEHCKKLKPQFAKAAQDTAENQLSIAFIKVDCTSNGKETCEKNEIESYPTLKIFHKGKFLRNYEGLREASAIEQYMKAQLEPDSKNLTTIEDLDVFLNSTKVSVVGFFEEQSDLKAAFMKSANKLREKVQFGHSSNKALLDKQDFSDGIVLFRPRHLHNKFEDNSVVYDGGAVTEDINNFIAKNQYGLVGHRTLDNMEDFQNPLVVAYYAVDYVKNPKGTNYWRNRIFKVAKNYKEQITFAISTLNHFENDLRQFGIENVQAEKPIIVAKDAKSQKFVMKELFTTESLQQFVQDLLDGKLEPYVKSEPIPDNKNVLVTIAVAKNFEETVINNGKDTLLSLYAPWCNHCRRLAIVLYKLAEKLQDEDVAIVKINAEANEIPDNYSLRGGFPTIYWATKDSKDNPVLYNDGRELDDFVKYIAKHSTNELKGYDRGGNAKGIKTEL